jgi:hypothetical protein
MKLDSKGNVPKNLPIMSYDPVDRLVRNIQRYDPSFTVDRISEIFDYPIASDYELMKIYLYGGARPFVDFLVYISLGVGWDYRAVGFTDDEAGREAVQLAEKFTKDIKLPQTMKRFATFYEVLGRACIIKTRNLAGGFYSDPNAAVKGVDCVNPMTVTDYSVFQVGLDKTGTVPYQQEDYLGNTFNFDQDRVYWRTQNGLSAEEKSQFGVSRIQGSVGYFRTLAKFPEYQSKLLRLYTEVIQTIIIDTSKMEGPLKDKLMKSNAEAQKFLDETTQYYMKLARQGSIASVFDWFEIVNTTFAGKEVNIDVIEDRVLSGIARNFGVPLALLDASSAEMLNRSILEAIRDTMIAVEENGTRKLVFQPIIEEIVNEYLASTGVTQGTVECVFNPFLSDNILEAAQIISLIWDTQAMSRPEVRPRIKLPNEIDLGGKDWSEKTDISPMPEATAGTATELDENGNPVSPTTPTGPQNFGGPIPDGNSNAVKRGGVKAPPSTDKVNQMRKHLLKQYPDLIKVIKDG